MTENRYGNLLDKVMKDNEKPMEHGRYGDLLEKVKGGKMIEEQILNTHNAIQSLSAKREREEERLNIRRQERIERERCENAEHKERNNRFINSYLSKEEEKVKEQKRKQLEEKKQQDRYNTIEKLIKINPKRTTRKNCVLME